MQSMNTGNVTSLARPYSVSRPAAVGFVMNRLPLLDNRHDAGVVVRVQKCETGAVVEASIEVDDFDAEVMTVVLS